MQPAFPPTRQSSHETLASWLYIGLASTRSRHAAMGILTFSINLTLDGCVDHREGTEQRVRLLIFHFLDLHSR